MKKTEYIKPGVKFLMIGNAALLSGSVTGDTGTDTIGYGGVDEEGNIEPNAKPFGDELWSTSIWDD